MSDNYVNSLNDALRRVSGSAVLAAAIDRFANNAAAIAAQLQQAVLAQVPEFSKSRNPDLLPELAGHGREHVEEIVRLLRGGDIGRGQPPLADRMLCRRWACCSVSCRVGHRRTVSDCPHARIALDT